MTVPNSNSSPQNAVSCLFLHQSALLCNASKMPICFKLIKNGQKDTEASTGLLFMLDRFPESSTKNAPEYECSQPNDTIRAKTFH